MISANEARELERISVFGISDDVWSEIREAAKNGGSCITVTIEEWREDSYVKGLNSLGYTTDVRLIDNDDTHYELNIFW